MPSIRHNSIRDITAKLLTEVCPNVGIEPTLQPLNGQVFNRRTADDARLDIKAQNFWDNSRQSTFFDVRVFNAYAPSNSSSSTDACYRRHDCEKRRNYEQRVIEVEHCTFTPLVRSSSGGWGPSATVAFKRLVSFHRIMANRTVGPCTTSGAGSSSASFTLLWLASGVPNHPFILLPEINLIDHPLNFIHSEVHLPD